MLLASAPEAQVDRILLVIALLAIATSFVPAQNNHALPPVTLQGNTVTTSSAPSHSHTGPSTPPFCPPSSCLYYGGDVDSSFSGTNGLFNFDYTDASLMGQAWVGVKPDRDVTVTGATFVELNTGGDINQPHSFL
jgi:hypothetical protein